MISQTPLAQVSPELTNEQTVPHAPQLASVVSEVSQPLASTPSQLAKPGLQKSIRHEPFEHSAVAFARAHATPHPPQLVSVVNEVSQPLVSMPSQFANPLLQEAVAHVPLRHVALALARAHAMPQPPQSTVLRSDVSHPFASSASQSPKPAKQEPMRQLPLVQSAIAPARPHAVRQLPQSVVVRSEVSQPFATLPSQSAHPASQLEIPQLPLEQSPLACAGAQARPHAPQLVKVLTRVSQPLLVIPSQLPKPGTQSVSVQAPAAHDAVPLGNAQGTPHAPQFERLRIEVSQPSAVDALQSSKPGEHVVTRQMPVEQSPVPEEGAQILSHAPQSTLVVSGDSQPLSSRPSQSPQFRSQLAIAHVPVEQLEVEFGAAHSMAQPPQCEFDVSGCSQPSDATPLQSPKPASQVTIVHDPASHPATATCSSVQASPQPPQSLGVSMSTSHPSEAIALQSS